MNVSTPLGPVLCLLNRSMSRQSSCHGLTFCWWNLWHHHPWFWRVFVYTLQLNLSVVITYALLGLQKLSFSLLKPEFHWGNSLTARTTPEDNSPASTCTCICSLRIFLCPCLCWDSFLKAKAEFFQLIHFRTATQRDFWWGWVQICSQGIICTPGYVKKCRKQVVPQAGHCWECKGHEWLGELNEIRTLPWLLLLWRCFLGICITSTPLPLTPGEMRLPGTKLMRRQKDRARILRGKTPSEASATKQIQWSSHMRGIEEGFPQWCCSRVMEPLSLQMHSEDGEERSETLLFFFNVLHAANI